MMDVLSEKSKERIPEVSYRVLEARRKEICARRLLRHFISRIPKFVSN
jgi:hypothetical protein